MKKGTVKHLENTPGKQNLAEIQKIVLTITAQILRIHISYNKIRQKKGVRLFIIFRFTMSISIFILLLIFYTIYLNIFIS